MKANTTQHAKLILFLAAFAILIPIAGANAQTAASYGRFTLPYQVHWGKAVLPAGGYTINVFSVHSPAIVQSTNGKLSAFVIPIAVGGSKRGAASLTVVARGSERKVASLNLPEAGISLVYSPMTDAEREMLARANEIETVPLITASK